MPALKLFKTLWGFQGGLQAALELAGEDGFDGIEGPAPSDGPGCQLQRRALQAAGLDWIAEICTTGTYVADRRASLETHLHDFRAQAERAAEAGARSITCLGGCDAWSVEQSVTFFGTAMDLARAAGLTVSFETHRGRSLFNPWDTARIIDQLPTMRLTADFSHWCVVCERMLDTEEPELERVIPRVDHVHARVGFEQGPQVPHPGAPEWRPQLQVHQQWWQRIWESQMDRGATVLTMTPEFGPDGYLHHAPFSNQPVADLRELNLWIAECEREHFASFLGQQLAS